MLLIGSVVRTVHARERQVVDVREDVADVSGHLLGHLHAEAEKDVVSEAGIVVVEAVGSDATRVRVERRRVRIELNAADASADIRHDVAAEVEVLDQVQHQRGGAERTRANRTDGSARLYAEELVGNVEFDIAVAGNAFKTETARKSVAEAGP